jgi:hypothetical protein
MCSVAYLAYLVWQEAKAFREKLLVDAIAAELTPKYAGIQSAPRGPWRVPTAEEGAWLDGQPPIWDGYNRTGQTWQWVTNDFGEWMYKRVQDSGIRIRIQKSDGTYKELGTKTEKSVLTEKP